MAMKRDRKCTAEEKNRSIRDDVFEKHLWHNESGYNGKLTNKRCEFDLSVPERIGRTMLILFGHVERVGKERVTEGEGDHRDDEGMK